MIKIFFLITLFFTFSFSANLGDVLPYTGGKCVTVTTSPSIYPTSNGSCYDNIGYSVAPYGANFQICISSSEWQLFGGSVGNCLPPLPTVTSNVVTFSGTNIVHFSDDATMMIFSDGKAMAWDIDGNEISNREYNGATPPLATFEENQAFNPTAYKKYQDFSLEGIPVFLYQSDGKIGFHARTFLEPLAFPALAWTA